MELENSLIFRTEPILIFNPPTTNSDSSSNDESKLPNKGLKKIDINDGCDLSGLRNKKKEILENLDKSQKLLSEASQLYPSAQWSLRQINRLNQLNYSMKNEDEIYNEYKDSLKMIKKDIYLNNLKNTESVIKEIDDQVTECFPYFYDNEEEKS